MTLKAILKNLLTILLPMLMLLKKIIDFFRKEKKILIITFHEVPENKRPLFQQVIKFLVDWYEPINSQQMQDFFDKKWMPKKDAVLITFDDGFQSSAHAAFKYLDPLKIKAVFFVCPQFLWPQHLSSKEFVNDNIYQGELNLSPEKILACYHAPMNNDDLTLLLEHGHTIGSHTNSHLNLGPIHSEQILKDELCDSAQAIQSMVHRPVPLFAYPFGAIAHINAHSLKAIKNYYLYCFSNVRGSNYLATNAFALRRQNIDLRENFLFLKFIMLGGIDLFYFKHRRQLDEIAQNKY